VYARHKIFGKKIKKQPKNNFKNSKTQKKLKKVKKSANENLKPLSWVDPFFW
jgi:hypothetical protein